MRYIIKGNDVLVIWDEGAANFDPSIDSEYTRAYLAWVAEGNTAEEWNPE